jgi:molybdopterin molybdotransferase
MDGYAVQAADVAAPGRPLRVIGEAPAGHAFPGTVQAGETVRILTGAPMPAGTDTVLIQENARREGDSITPLQAETPGRFVRPAGMDFREGQRLLRQGRRLTPRDLALAAAMNHPAVPVHRRPRVAIIATGDELVRPGDARRDDQIIASNSYAVAAMVQQAGGVPVDLGLVSDDLAALVTALRAAQEAHADVIVTLGGASVGDHDLVQPALASLGLTLGFWRIAMRPGKPLMFGTLQGAAVLGLPGNPVSSIVCAILFLDPLLRALSGDPLAAADRTEPAILASPLAANDQRQDYLRATITGWQDGLPRVAPAARQDSGMLAVFTAADALILRPPHAAAAAAGEPCRILPLEHAMNRGGGLAEQEKNI